MRFLEDAVDDIEWDVRIREPHISDMVVVFIGGNDLDSPDVDVRRLASRYIDLYERLAKTGSHVIVFSQWPRPGARIGGVGFWTNALWFDHLLRQRAKVFSVWDWDRRLRACEDFFVDGVHCKPQMYKRVMRYFSAAIFFGMRCMMKGRPFAGEPFFETGGRSST